MLMFERIGNLDSDGHFAFTDIQSGTYDILIKVDGYLAKLIPDFTVADGTNNLVVEAIIPGDVTGDNNITITDICSLSAVFGSRIGDSNYNPLMDVNCDGVVNIIDVSVFTTVFGMQGDQVGP